MAALWTELALLGSGLLWETQLLGPPSARQYRARWQTPLTPKS
jgi:hypothetical protein